MLDVKKLILATISFVVLSLPIAMIWHMVLFHEEYEAFGAFTRSEPIIPLGMLSMVMQGAVIAYLYPFYNRGGNPIKQGIKFSLLMGVMIYTMMGFSAAAKTVIEPVPEFLMYVTAYCLIQFTVTGAALGLIYGREGDRNKVIAKTITDVQTESLSNS